MNTSSIPSDAFVLRPPTDRRAWFYATLGVVATVPVAGGFVADFQHHLVTGFILSSVIALLWIAVLAAVITRVQRRTLVAVSDTHVFVWDKRRQCVERDRVAWMTQGPFRDSLHDTDGRVLMTLPDLLSRDQGRQVAAALGVLHLDRRGRLIVPPTPVGTLP